MPAQDPSHLPTQISCIAQTGDQALSDKRWGDVSSIASQEDTSLTKTLTAPGMEAIDGFPLDIHLVGIAPWCKPFFNLVYLLNLLDRFVRPKHELPALPATRSRQVRTCALSLTVKLDVVNGLVCVFWHR